MTVGHFHRLTVADVRRETADCVSVALTVPETLAEVFRFRPGQYLTLRTWLDGEECRRSYSICAAPDEGELRVAIKRLEGGAFSGWANDALRSGDPIEAMPPDGRFLLPDGGGAVRTVVAFAAGSGITPVLPIIRTVLGQEPGSRVFLFYGNRNTAGIIFRGQLEDLKDRYMSRLSVFHVVSREQQDVPALNGRLDPAKVQLLMRHLAPPRVDQAFVCGPFAMIEGLEKALLDLGLPRERVHVERFTPAPGGRPRATPLPRAAAPRAIATIIAEGARTDIPVMANETIIEAGERAGLALPYSCRGGMCCTCRARVLEGRVEMAVNYSLESWETAAGFVLTCQSTPATERVVLDYDQL